MTSGPKYVQSDPAASSSMGKVVEKPQPWRTLSSMDLSRDADDLLCWLARYPVRKNHPRAPVEHAGIKRSGEVVVCSDSDKLPKVFAELITQGFLSCPIVSSDGRYEGFIDMLGISKAVLKAFGVYRAKQGRGENDEIMRGEDYAAFMKLDEFTQAAVKSVSDIALEKLGGGLTVGSDMKDQSPKSLVTPAVFPSFSLLYAFELMARGNTRRVPICDSKLKPTGILTNSMVISLLDQNMTKLGAIRHMPVSSMMGGLRNEIISVKTSDIALDAFKLMSSRQIFGVAVLDHRGVLVDNLSVRDLRIIGDHLQNFLRLYLTVAAFKQTCRHEFKRQTPERPITVTRSDTIADVIKAFDDGNIHRVYLCHLDDDKHLIPDAVITQRDLMTFILWQCGLQPTTELIVPPVTAEKPEATAAA